MATEFDFESIKTKALEQLKSGKSLLGKDGAFAGQLHSSVAKLTKDAPQSVSFCQKYINFAA